MIVIILGNFTNRTVLKALFLSLSKVYYDTHFHMEKSNLQTVLNKVLHYCTDSMFPYMGVVNSKATLKRENCLKQNKWLKSFLN